MMIELIIFITTVVFLFIISILSNRVWYRKSVEQERIWSELTRKIIRESNKDLIKLESRISNLEKNINTIVYKNGEVIENDGSLQDDELSTL